MLQKVAAAIQAHAMVDRGDCVVAGVSGGADSLALLDTLIALRERLGYRVHVAHLNHQLRGDEAVGDAVFVEEIAKELGCPVSIGMCDVRALRVAEGLSLEEAARVARYAFYLSVVRRQSARGVVVGHTADDQVETVIMHWLRGAGLAGQQGMRPVSQMRVRIPDWFTCLVEEIRNGQSEEYHVERTLSVDSGARSLAVLRPMLEVTRAEVLAYCAERKLRPRVDSSNYDEHISRNAVRKNLLPKLRQFNPRLDEAARRSAEIAAADLEFLSHHVQTIWPTVARLEDDVVSYRLAEWRGLPHAMKAALLRQGATRLKGDLVGITAVHVADAIRAVDEKPAGTMITWPQGLQVVKRYDDFQLFRERPHAAPLPRAGELLAVPGCTGLPGRGTITVRVQSERCKADEDDRRHADLDGDRVGSRLVVRRRRAGDRFQPLGMRESKKLQDFFVDAKIPRGERDAVPVVDNGEGIVWLVGERMADWAKVTANTKCVLCCRLDVGVGNGFASADAR